MNKRTNIMNKLPYLEKELLETDEGKQVLNRKSPFIGCTKKEGSKVQDLENKTIIGTSNKKIVATNDNARHLFVCGTTGAGKTVLLGNYIENAVAKEYPTLIIDGKGDTGKGSLLDIVFKFAKHQKVYVINLTSPETSAKYNPFKNGNSTIYKDMLVNLTTWSEEHYKANTERYVQRLIWVLEKQSIPISFHVLVEYMAEDKLTKLSTDGVKKKLFTKEEHSHTLQIISLCGKIAQDAAARFVTMCESEIGTIFAEDGIDIYEAMEEKAIILFILNPLLYPELSPLIGRLILTDAKKAVSKLYMTPKDRTFFIFDEVNSYASPIFIDLINKSRSANVTCIAATQSLADLEYQAGEAFKQQVIENCNNYIVMRQNSAKSAEEWASILGTKKSMEMTYQVGKRQEQTVTTGMGSVKQVREFRYHPDEIKMLQTGEAIYMSKDTGNHCKFKVRKGF